jgi:iron complex transport system substrate-binding protein
MDGDIRRSGGRNVASEIPGFAPSSIEQLLVWNPDVILLNNFEPGLSPAELLEDPRLQSLSAVRQRRVYLFPHGGFRWDPPSQETPLALDWLFSLMHPEHAEPGLRQRIADAYRLLYGYQVSATDLDDLLQMDVNVESTHYRELFGGVQ